MTDDGEARPEELGGATVAEVFARPRDPVELSDEEILSAIHDGRR